MKKLICLLLVIIIICTTMVSCTKSEDIPYICYTADESLTARDIEFLSASPQLFKEINHTYSSLSGVAQEFQWYKEGISQPTPLLLIQNDLENRYYLCLYTYEDSFKSLLVTFDRIFNTKLSAKYFVWYRFECDVANIPLEIDGKELMNTFFICDSVIKKDLMTEKNYNINSTFYCQLGPNPVDGEPYAFTIVWENMLHYRSAIDANDLDNNSEHLFLTNYAYDKKSYYGNDYELFENEEGVLYIVFYSYDGLYETGKALIHDEDIQWHLYGIYDALLPYFELLELPGHENADYQTIGIKLEVFEELFLSNDN